MISIDIGWFFIIIAEYFIFPKSSFWFFHIILYFLNFMIFFKLYHCGGALIVSLWRWRWHSTFFYHKILIPLCSEFDLLKTTSSYRRQKIKSTWQQRPKDNQSRRRLPFSGLHESRIEKLYIINHIYFLKIIRGNLFNYWKMERTWEYN